MISLLSMIVNTIAGALLFALKAFFSLVIWFVRAFVKFFKFFIVTLPVTAVVFLILMLVNLAFLLSGGSLVTPSEAMGPDASKILSGGAMITLSLFGSLKTWWLGAMAGGSNSGASLVILILSILMFIPVICVLLFISVVLSYGSVLFISVVADAVLYIIMAVFGKSFISQAMGRYYRLFPDAGRKHEERQYDKWVRKRNREFEQEERDRRRGSKASFYDNEDDYDDDYDEDFENDYGDEYDDYDDRGRYDARRAVPHRGRYERLSRRDYYPDEYDDPDEYYGDEEYDELEDFNQRGYDDEDYDDEDYDEEDEDFEDDYDDPKRAPEPTPHAAFDFFAGCSSLESVDKKYKSLVKLYHPDNMDGDTAALQEINAQYAEVKKKYK